MVNRANYVTLEAVKNSSRTPDTTSDIDIKRAIQAATDVMPRQFFVTVGTRYFEASRNGSVLLKGSDLLSVTALATDDGTRTYPNAWSASPVQHYDLEPYNAPFETPPHPYWKINRIGGLSTYSFPLNSARGVRVTGKWGFYEVFSPTTVTINMSPGGLTIGGTALTVSAANIIETGNTLAIEDEQLFVTAVAGAVATVERGVNGTVAATHAHGLTARIYSYPLVEEATHILAMKYLRRIEDAPLGIVGGMDGFMRVAINDPQVQELVGRFVRVGVA